jgi:hypothetical protein
MARKIIQICSAAWDAGGSQTRTMMLFALADDGNVYSLEVDRNGVPAGWTALPALPDMLSLSTPSRGDF